ncbi:hypothetical protein [Candidatus Nitrosocosmicus sp. SS]|jgi:hypothetical protein|uniref:hypothetical protein n=1 Tax=Candidatus Nitrosocosmicus agrestis TaxID=2563600 RepID=UPI00122E2EEF|nr:hypothetical protein [Candidatus Nitrosocosmicus sp. SS]KAA2280352.1 hypothetical protein F1Z66_11195 [Candidatus Nitrosocosmicus sp. SS]KAF0868028.1 hypothetical protein E5N71_12195 [Candidatus Nitrosocosmicus sp. SS]MDR4491538.1 hypothetical protein [Candidatus Nitrosocosmicus sp.]
MHSSFKNLGIPLLAFITAVSILIISYSNNSYSTTEPTDGNQSLSLAIDNLTNTNNISTILNNEPSNINLELSPETKALLNSSVLNEDLANMNNLTNFNNSGSMLINDTQLSGTEKVKLLANFSSKPFGLDTDYYIKGKPLILINNNPLTYEFVNDTSDEITVSDILISMRASVKLDNSSVSTLPVYVKVFANPVNITKNPDGSETLINNPSMVENIEIGGVIFSDASTTVRLYPNGTGILNATN